MCMLHSNSCSVVVVVFFSWCDMHVCSSGTDSILPVFVLRVPCLPGSMYQVLHTCTSAGCCDDTRVLSLVKLAGK